MSTSEVQAPKPRVERKAPLPPAETMHRRTRKRFHLVFFLIFLVLPFSNLMRFDIPRQRFYLAGFELWISEFAILFFAIMFLMFLVTASAILYGRIYCSYACPQMIFSEWSQAMEAWGRSVSQKLFPKGTARKVTGLAIFYAVLAIASVFLAFVFTSYFVEPRDLLSRLLHLDLVTVGGITGASVTLLTFLDLVLVRQKFCTTVCPYGYLQGMLQDRHTLLVNYEDPDKACIECGKCVRVCEMGIDIRKGPYQIECVHCGDCVDACEDVLRRLGHPGLIQYAWGEAPAGTKVREPWLHRIGLRDAKRWVILLIMLFYLVGLGIALSLRRPVLVYIASDRSTLYTVQADGKVVNRVRIKLANRSPRATTVRLWVDGLPGAELALPANPVPLALGEVLEQTVDLRAMPWADAQDVTQIRILAQAQGDRAPDATELTFLMPLPRK
ncbi:MAG: 4Fe-4S binding protein [Holophaga sp.]|nr:4Fe-4S binding protein [Holophaga sp.]